MKKLLYILLFVPLGLFGQDNYSLNFQTVDAGVNLGNSNFFQINESDTMTKTIMFWAKDDWIDDTRRNFMTKGACASSSCMDIHFWYNVSDSEIVFATGFSEDACSHGIISHLLSDKWNFFSITIKANSNSSGEKKLYLNGELLFSCNYLYNALSNDEDLYVGFSSSTNANQIKPIKYIDNLSIWDRVLTEEEINYFMRNNVVGDEVNLLGGWDFNEGIGNIATDISGNGNNGDIFGGFIYSIDYPKLGCVDSIAFNYNPEATVDDGSCISQEEYTIDSLNSVIEQATASLSSLQQALDTWNTTIDLSEGWNMFGYGCPTSIDVAEGLSNHTENIIITKDNSGNVYMPEFGFNGIGDFTPGFGYQIKVTEDIEGFSLCDWYVNDIPEDNIVSLQEENADLNQQIKCLTNPEIGDFCYGGIIFYMDSLSQNGFVAATQDLINNVDPVANGVPEGFEWGCYGIDIETSSTIGSGYSNTLSIVNQNCQTQNGGLSAAEAALNYEDNEYSDWYLPSKDELLEIYYNIGPESENMNLGIFETEFYPAYWSSSSADGSIVNIDEYAQEVSFADGITTNNFRNSSFRVRPIRAFGFILGCMDETACNFNAEANMANGSCEYAEQGYDCDGNLDVQIGDEAFGGIVFYVDESGEHGLVANINDIDGVYEEIGDNNGYLWGCFDGQSTDVPFNILSTEIGYGEYNTNEIIEYCQEENIAAKLADSFEDNTYTDWYLPSLGELSILCHVHSENSNKFNYDSRGFWTSSYNLSSYSPYFIDFYNSTYPGIYDLNCSEHFHPHNTIRGVIPIRSF